MTQPIRRASRLFTSWSHRQRIGAIIALGAVLRLAFLGNQPLWRDEAFNALAIHKPLGDMLRVVSNDSAPPLIYIVQHFIATFWYTPASIRLTSAIGGIVAIPIAGRIGRRAGGEVTELWTAFAMAVFPSAVLASRDARMYSVAMTFALGAVLTLWRFTERRTLLRWLAFTATCVACLYTDYFTAFAICGTLLAALLWLRPSWRTIVAAGAGAALALASLTPWLLYAKGQLSHASDQFWVNPIDIFTLSGVAIQFFAGPPTDDGVPFAPLQRIVQTIVQFGGIAAFTALYFARRQLSGERRRLIAFILCSGFFAIGGLVLISFWHPLVEARYASAMWGPLICGAGIGLSLLRRVRIRIFAVAAMLTCSVVLISLMRNPDTPKLLRAIPHLGPHDLIEAGEPAYLLIRYYGTADIRQHTHVVMPGGVPWYWGTAAYPRDAVLPSVPPSVVKNHGTIYYIDVPGYWGGIVPGNYRPAGDQTCYSTLCITPYVPK